jgi:hypothetical protein
MQVPKSFSQVITIPHGQSHQKRPQSRFFGLYDLPPIQVRFVRRGAPSNRAQRAKQMLHAKAGAVQPHFVDGEVVPEGKVIPALGKPLLQLLLTFNMGLDKLRYIESAFLCFAVTIDPLG